MLQLSRSFSLPTPDGIRQSIVRHGNFFLDWDTADISISHGWTNEPLQIAYHDGSTQVIPEVSNAFSFTPSDPDGLYYLYKEPSGFGKTRKVPQYRSDGEFPFNGTAGADWNQPLIPRMATAQTAQITGLGVSVSSEAAPNYGWKLFDRSTGNWLTTSNTSTGWVDLYHASFLTIGGYSIKNHPSSVRRDPTAWTVKDSDTDRILDTRSGIAWSGSEQTQQFTFSEPFFGRGLLFEFSASNSVGGGTQLGLSEIQLFPPLAPQADWIYSVPDAIARGADGNERKRVYLGTANWVQSEFRGIVEFRPKNSFAKVPYYSSTADILTFMHRQGVPREFLAVEVDFPLGGSGTIVAVDELSVYYRASVMGLVTVSVRRTF